MPQNHQVSGITPEWAVALGRVSSINPGRNKTGSAKSSYLGGLCLSAGPGCAQNPDKTALSLFFLTNSNPSAPATTKKAGVTPWVMDESLSRFTFFVIAKSCRIFIHGGTAMMYENRPRHETNFDQTPEFGHRAQASPPPGSHARSQHYSRRAVFGVLPCVISFSF